MEFFGNRGAADDAALFQYRDLQAGSSQVEGAHQAVVAAAYDNRISERITHRVPPWATRALCTGNREVAPVMVVRCYTY
jgi:hypothetical protein